MAAVTSASDGVGEVARRPPFGKVEQAPTSAAPDAAISKLRRLVSGDFMLDNVFPRSSCAVLSGRRAELAGRLGQSPVDSDGVTSAVAGEGPTTNVKVVARSVLRQRLAVSQMS